MKHINIKDGNYTKDKLEEIAKIVKSGGIAIIPTDTVYGIVADALNENAVKKIYDLKQRDMSNPMSVLVSDISMIKKITKNISSQEEEIINNFFPGALTIIFNKSNIVPNIVTAGLDTIGVRMPNNKFILELIKTLKVPIVATSCNLASEMPIIEIDEIKRKFKNKVDCIVDEGKAKIGIPSTIIKMEEGKIKVLREGPISKKEIEDIIL